MESTSADAVEVAPAVPFDARSQSRFAALGQRRWQIFFGFLVAVLLPAVIRWPHNMVRFDSASLNNSMAGTSAALLAGYFLTRKLAAFPGVEVYSFILPIFSASYGIMAAGLLLTRCDYSRFQLMASFALAIAFYHYAFLVERRTRRLRLVVVSHGDIDRVLEIPRVDWSVCQSPTKLPHHYDGLIADLNSDIGEEWAGFLERCALAGVPVYHSKLVQESLTGRVDVRNLSENMLGSRVPSPLYARVKCGLDIVVALLVLPLIGAICGVAAILIKIDSRGPVLIVRDSIGYRGQIFRLYKLRTIHTDAWGDGGRCVTRIGAVLRKYRIDELPQILNILKGEMSWIGPRPDAQPLSELYQRKLAFYPYRHIVRPGITGWAQVNQGYAPRPEMLKYRLHFDFYYIKNFSPWLDLVIAAQTVRTVFMGLGSL